MKKIISLPLIFCLISATLFLRFYSLESSIKSINSFDEVDFKEMAISSSKLVIFDVDQTLVYPGDAYLMHEHTQQGRAFRTQLLQKYSTITKKEWTDIASIMLKESRRPLIEPQIIDYINTLKKNNIPIIACTAMNTGPYGILPTMEQWRYEHLKSLEFEGSFQSIFPLEVPYFKLPCHNYKPQFYKGILATDQAPKGPIIGAFLDAMNLHFDEIIMFDDCLDFLKSVEQEFKKRRIVFTGYLYKGASFIKEKPWDEKLFSFQAEYLVKNRKWLDDENARKLLTLTQDKQNMNDALALAANIGFDILTNW